MDTLNTTYMDSLNSEQLQAATTIDGPLVIIAGAGSGKTHTLTCRLSNLINRGVAPESILLLTFTNAAANEMTERASRMLDERCKKITACTYHSFCVKMLRFYGECIGLKRSFTIITPSEVQTAIGFVKAEDKKYKLRGFPQNKKVADIISSAKNKKKSIKDILKTEQFIEYAYFAFEIQEISNKLDEYKKSKNMLDFDDLLIYFAKLLENEKNTKKNIGYIQIHNG